MMKDLVLKNRSYRRFHEDVAIERKLLEDLVDLARLSPSGMNQQPLKFRLCCTGEDNRKVFKHLRWAGYLKEWSGPSEGERPAAYIVMVLDTQLASQCFWDHGIAAQSIMLGAVEKGYGGCMFGSFDRQGLQTDLGLDGRYQILMVLALGKPKETVVLEPLGPQGDIKYYRDEDGIHHVPKRALSDVLI